MWCFGYGRSRHPRSAVEQDGDYYEALQEESLWLQKRAADIIKQLSFNAETSRTSIMEAIDHFVATKGKIGEHPPIAFLNKKTADGAR